MKGLISWFARNSVVANLLLVVIGVSGAITLGPLKREVFPELTLDMITVDMEYRGAAPEEVEEAICIRIEEAVQAIEGIKQITSTANEGRGQVTIELISGYDSRRALDDVKSAVDEINTFPDDAEKPIIRDIEARNPVINVSIAGETDLATLKKLGVRVRDDLAVLPEISQVSLLSTPAYEISIEVSEEALKRWGLTFDEIAGAVRRFSVDLPGGSVKAETGEILLRADGQAYTGEEYEQLPLRRLPDGTSILLRDVATVVDGFEDVTVTSKLDGRPAVTIQVSRIGDENAIAVAEAVYRYVDSAAGTMPDGIEISTWLDSARLLKSRIDLLSKNALTGLVLVFAVLALFLRLRLAFWVTLGIPISFLGAIATMPLFGVSINMMSLFAFILVLGIVVDDAIVVGENIHTTQQRTGKGTSAAIRGTCEVLVPVTFGVLTTMAAFSPMLFVPGIIGKVMGVLPLIVLPTLFFSLVESKLILPCHLSRVRKPHPGARRNALSKIWNGFFDAFSNGLERFIQRAYRPFVSKALEWRYLTLSAALFCMLVTVGLIGAGQVRTVLFPTVDSDNVIAFLTMPQDSTVEVTAEGVRRIESEAIALRELVAAEHGRDQIRHVLTTVGEQPYRAVQGGPAAGSRTHQGEFLGEVNLELVPGENRSVSSEEIASRWREMIERIPGAVELSVEHDMIGGSKSIDIQFSATDLATVLEVAEIAKGRLAEYPGVVEITDTYRGGKRELNLALTSEGEALGLTLQDLGRQVRQGFFGEEAQRIQRGRDDIRVMIRYPRSERSSEGDLERIRVRTPGGDEVPFSTVATASMGRGPATIRRANRSRSINVQAAVDESVTTSGQVLSSLEADFLPQLLERFPGVTYSFEGDQADFAESMEGLGRGFFVAMFVVFAMLAIPLRSYVKPSIIVTAVPFGMVGAVWGHWLLGLDLSFLSMCGMVALAGVVVNDGLVLVSFIDRNRRSYRSLRDAVEAAGVARFRAILLTSLTTAAGVTPLMLEKSLQAQFLIPMAVALASGVLFATAVTLVLVPSLYLIVEDLRGFASWLRHGRPQRPRLRAMEVETGAAAATGD